MQLVVRILLLALVLVVLLVSLVMVSPVTASRLFWPAIEALVLRDDFLGITTDGNVKPGLFQVEVTGVSTQNVIDAADTYAGTLSTEQRDRLFYPVDDLEWRRWANIHISHRQGVGFLEMNEAQTRAALGLLEASLSERGLKTSRDIMKLEGHLADLKEDHAQYGEKRYWLTIMGEPSVSEPWGWQIDGHHLVINYFVLGDQVVASPLFMGSEPTRAESGRYAGTEVLKFELEAGLMLINALGQQEREIAIVDSVKVVNHARGELFQDNAIVPFEGVLLAGLNPAAQSKARKVIELFINNIAEGHARVKLEEIEDHWDETYFSWVGGFAQDSVFYYRIHSPVVMIEFDHQAPVALDGPAVPTREHVHTVIRTPNGNDYGKDLLRQHLANHPH